VSTVLDLDCDLVIILTDNGNIARMVSKYRPPVPILACCVNNQIIRQLQTVRGITGLKIPTFIGTDNVLQTVIQAAKEKGLCKSGSKVVCIHSNNENTPDESNILKIIDIQ
jgi:pyruvate kinase